MGQKKKPEHPSDGGLDWSLDEGDLTNTLYHHESSALLFGLFEAQTVIADLENEGVLETLRQRGYKNFRGDSSSHVKYEDRFRLLAEHECDSGQCLVLFDVRTHTSHIDWEGGQIQVLYWDWLEFQDPKGVFEPDRPPLPGQEHPGLGVFREITQLLDRYVSQTPAEAIVAIPEYFHNAWLYSRSFQFLEAPVEGTFRALIRDLMPAGLSRASHAVDQGEVLDQDGQIFRWQPHQQVCPLNEITGSYFTKPDYLESVKESESRSFRFSETQESNLGDPK